MSKKRLKRLARERLRALREANNWSQARLAEEVGCPQPMICQLETGVLKYPKLPLAFRIAEVAASKLGGKLPPESWLD